MRVLGGFTRKSPRSGENFTRPQNQKNNTALDDCCLRVIFACQPYSSSLRETPIARCGAILTQRKTTVFFKGFAKTVKKSKFSADQKSLKNQEKTLHFFQSFKKMERETTRNIILSYCAAGSPPQAENFGFTLQK